MSRYADRIRFCSDVIFRVNALALLVGSGIAAKLLGIIRSNGGEAGKTISLQQAIFDSIFLSVASPIDASLMYAVSFIPVRFFLMWLLYRKGIYIKV
ncbi:MAG: hypothetical protein ACR2L1_05605 [Pyrinomonadaceae bacterium]